MCKQNASRDSIKFIYVSFTKCAYLSWQLTYTLPIVDNPVEREVSCALIQLFIINNNVQLLLQFRGERFGVDHVYFRI